MADENKQIEMKKISALDELDSLDTDSYTVVSKNGSSYKFDLSKIKADVDLTDINRELNEHSGKLNEHTNKLTELENELDGNLKISSIDETTLKLEDGKLSVIGGGNSTSDVTKQYVDDEINDVKDLIDDKADKTHTHGISDVNGLLHDNGQEVYQRRTDLSLREFTVVESINENYKDIKKLQTDKVDKVPDMDLMSTAEKQKLATIADGAEVNVQADWNEPDIASDAYIKNKPDLSTYATKTFVSDEIAKAVTSGTIDLDGYATKEDTGNKENLTTTERTNLVTAINEVDGNTKTNANSISTLDNRVQELENSNFLKEVPTEYITETELTAKRYLTQHQSLDAYALKTDIPTVPTKTSELTNDSNFLTTIPSEYVTETELSGKGYLTEHQSLDDYAKKSDIPTNHVTQNELAEVSGKVATLETSNATLTGNVATLTGEVTTLKTTVEGIDTTYATKEELTNGLKEKVNSSELHAVAKSGSYNDLDDKPGIPTKTSELTNDSNFLTTIPAEYITEAELTDKGYLTQQSLADYAKTSDVPTTVAELTDSNAYAKASNIPTKVSNLANDSGFITEAELTGYAKTSDIDTTYAKKAELDSKANSADLATVAKSGKYTDLTDTPTLFSGNYNDLTNKPTLFDGNYNSLTNTPTIPTTVAELTDKGDYALKTDIENLSYNDLNDKPTLFSGSYNDLNDKPTLFSGSYNDLADKPTIPSIDGLVDEQTLQDSLDLKADKTEIEVQQLTLLNGWVTRGTDFANEAVKVGKQVTITVNIKNDGSATVSPDTNIATSPFDPPKKTISVPALIRVQKDDGTVEMKTCIVSIYNSGNIQTGTGIDGANLVAFQLTYFIE